MHQKQIVSLSKDWLMEIFLKGSFQDENHIELICTYIYWCYQVTQLSVEVLHISHFSDIKIERLLFNFSL